MKLIELITNINDLGFPYGFGRRTLPRECDKDTFHSVNTYPFYAYIGEPAGPYSVLGGSLEDCLSHLWTKWKSQ